MSNLKKKRLGRGLEALLSATASAGTNEGPGSDAHYNDGDTHDATGQGNRDFSSDARVNEVEASRFANGGEFQAPGAKATNYGHSFASNARDDNDSAGSPHAATGANPSSGSSSFYAADYTSHSDATTPGMKSLQVQDSGIDLSTRSADGSDDHGISDIQRLDVFQIEDNPFQPRRVFSEPEIASLSESLKEHDMLQPILVRRVPGGFQLISGERRLRAAIQAGWKTIPARIRQADDRLVAELAIVENLQRKDLNALEKALSFRRYLHEHGSTQEELAARLKIDRSTIANLMRLLELPQSIQDCISNEKISAGHARALLPLGEEKEQITYCNRIIAEGWNVRETERRVADLIAEQDGPKAKSKSKSNPQHELLERQARMSLGTKVEIKANTKGAGKMVVHFKNQKEFERLFEQMCRDEGVLSRVA